MEPWIVMLILILVVGVAVIAYGSVSDRRRHQRAVAEIKLPPRRDIPHFSPDAEAPHYLTDLEAHRPPENAPSTALSPAEKAEITAERDGDRSVRVGARRASDYFISDKASGWSVLDRPRVLVCTDPVQSIRELIGILERMIASRQALVIMAPEFSEDVCKTLEVNQIRGMLRVLAVTADAEARGATVDATRATAVGAGDLRAGYLPDDHLGRCARWVAESRQSFVIAAMPE